MIDARCLVTIYGSAVFSAGIVSFASTFSLSIQNGNNSEEPSGIVFLMAWAGIVSVMMFGFLLLLRLKPKRSTDLSDILKAFKTDKASLLHYLLCCFLFCGTFSNSFVVEEASVYHFCVITSLSSFLLLTRCRGKKVVMFAVVLIAMGIIRLTNIYFRCREEQQSWCVQTDYHKPLANLPISVSKLYKQWRFGFTVISVTLTVLLPCWWLKKCGNLNGDSLPVFVMKSAPLASGTLLVFNWALQAKSLVNLPMDTSILLYAIKVLPIIFLAINLLSLLIIIIRPVLVYKEKVGQQSRDVIVPTHGGVKDYWNYMKTNWKQQFVAQPNTQQKILLYGIGTALSAAFVLIGTILTLMTMLVLGKKL